MGCSVSLAQKTSLVASDVGHFWKSERFHVLASRLPSLNDGVVTKQTFWIVLMRLFSFKFLRFLSTVGFSNEDNCCQLQGIGKFIKEKLSKGIVKVD